MGEPVDITDACLFFLSVRFSVFVVESWIEGSIVRTVEEGVVVFKPKEDDAVVLTEDDDVVAPGLLE